MDEGVEFIWDAAKSDACLRTRGFDFEYVTRIFVGAYLERVDDRYEYGEVRRQVIGRIEGRLYFVVYTQRGMTKRIISGRRADQEEHDRWLRSG